MIAAKKTDRREKDKPAPAVECADAAVREAAKDVIASGEVTGKSFETTLLHRPAGLKAKRLLLVGGGKAKNFSAAELRKLAGAAVRTLKSKSIRSFALALPADGVAQIPANDAVRAIVEGAFVGDFDPGYYKSDRKDKDAENRRPHHRRPAQAMPRPWKARCKPDASSPSRRTSPATWSTNPPTA